MFKMKSIIRSLLVLLLVMSFTSCVRDNISDFPMHNGDMKTYLQVQVTVEIVDIHERVGLYQDLKEVKMEMEENKESIKKMMSIPLPSYYINLIKMTCRKLMQQ